MFLNYIPIVMKSTNYYNTFIKIAEDCPVQRAEMPPQKRGGDKTVARLQFEIIAAHPYQYTSDDVIFLVYATRKEIPEHKLEPERERFFAKGQPCLRSSPLTKRYGWGIHCDKNGKIALYGCETEEYRKLSEDHSFKITQAMKSKR